MTTFTVSNYKGIVEEVSLTSGSGLVVLAGDNRQGKSSFLDAVREVVKFAGSRETPEPIRQGEDFAFAEIVNEKLGRRYRREWKRAKSGKINSEVHVYALDGAEYTNPARHLADDIGAEIIDAGEFSRKDAKEQRDILLRHIELPFDLDLIAAKKKAAETERTELGRDVKRLEGALASLPKGESGEEQSSSEILAEIDKAQALIRTRDTARAEYNAAADRVGELAEQIEQLTKRLEEAANRQTAALASLERVEVVPDVEPLQAKLRDLDDTNRAIRERKAWESTKAELEAVETKHKAAQKVIDDIDAQKREGLAAATFPDPLLSFDETGVIYDGIPFSQLNDADKQIVGARILVGASDRKLRIGFLKDGDLLDDANLERLQQVAKEAQYTFLVERGRDNSREIGWTFHEGNIKEEA